MIQADDYALPAADVRPVRLDFRLPCIQALSIRLDM